MTSFDSRRGAVPLTLLLGKLRRRKACVVVIGLAVLDALTTLHEAGLWHGAVHAGNVYVKRNGTVRLRGTPIAPQEGEEPDRTLRTADVRAAGVLLCSLLGIRPTSKEPASPSASTPLGLAVRAMAISVSRRKVRAGYEASQARLSLWEAAGRLASRQRQVQARQQLADLVLAELGPEAVVAAAVPGPPQTAPKPAAAAVQRPAWPGARSRAAGILTLVAVLCGCAVLTLATLPGIAAQRVASGAPTALTSRPAAPAPRRAEADPAPVPASPTAPALAEPALAPASAGDVMAVNATLAAGCGPGAACLLTVEVRLRPAAVARDVVWTLSAVDPCTGAVQTLSQGDVVAQAGWVRVLSWRVVQLPAAPRWLLALTTTPARASSPPLGPAPATPC
jgi:hypothetical protein